MFPIDVGVHNRQHGQDYKVQPKDEICKISKNDETAIFGRISNQRDEFGDIFFDAYTTCEISTFYLQRFSRYRGGV